VNNLLAAYIVEQTMLGGKGYNYQDEVLRTAEFKNIQFSAAGGTKSLKYYVSGGYQGDEGIMLKSNFQKLNFRTKFDIDFQNANAYSNLASIHIDEGEFAEAQKCVTAGLHILETANPNKSVSLLWDSNPKAILPIKLELMMHQVSIHMEKGEKSQANKLAKEIGIIANENDYDDGNVLAASYVLSQSDTGKPRN
jgi:hypothetical protein